MTKQLEGLCPHGRHTGAVCIDCGLEADLYQPNKQVDWKVEDVCIHGLKLGDTCALCDQEVWMTGSTEWKEAKYEDDIIWVDEIVGNNPYIDGQLQPKGEGMKFRVKEEITAQSILQEAINAISDRAPYRDANGKKTFELASEIFSKVVGHDLDEHDACMFLACVKLARSQQGEFHVDDFVDASAYISLAGEARARQVRPARKGPKMGEDMP